MMSFDGLLLQRIIRELEIVKTGRISKICESGDTDFIFTIRANHTNHNIMASFSSDYARIHLTTKYYDTVQNPKSFTMLLRKHIEGYFIEDIKSYKCDRITCFVLKGYNEMQDLCTKYLICETMGRYSNMVLTDESYRIIDSLKHDGVGEYNRTILPNAIYEFPKNEKLNPLDYSKEDLIKIIKEKKLDNPKDYLNTFNGISLNIAYPIFENDNHAEAFYNYLHVENKPVIIKNFKGKEDFYYHPLNQEVIKEYSNLSALLDDYYYEADLKAKVKLKTDDLGSFINRQINKYNKKIEKLEAEKREASKMDDYKMKGELLLSYPNLKEKAKAVVVFNYYTSLEEKIDLDNKITVLDNSNKYYKKYQKLKGSLVHIDEQINAALDEINYFTILKYQIEDCTINEALEIQDELIENKYLFKNVQKNKKKLKPKPISFILENGTIISVGKNNIQNEYLTHKLAKPNDMWFHIKGASGSHVVVHKDTELDELDIRTAANLASYYSEYKLSSSVAVDYTRIRNVKKIPGKRSCFVTYTHQKTIYIDPDYDKIKELKVKKQ